MVRKPCCSYTGRNRGPWTAEEDFRLTNYIKIHGVGNWRTLPMKAGLLRCGKGCRLRWMNYLRPDVKRGDISPDEEDMIIRLHKLVGNRWSLIAGRIPGRTDNEIKNYWNTHLRKRLFPSKLEPANTRQSFEDDNSPELSRIYGIANTFFGTSEAYSGYASEEALRNIESFKHKFNGSDNLTAINDFSNVLNTVDNIPRAYENHQSSSMAMPCNIGVPFIFITGNESITDMFLTNRINHVENLSWSESNMQLQGPMLTSEYTSQLPSGRDEINGALAVDYHNMAEPMNGNGNSNIVKSQLLESLSSLSDWYCPLNSSSFSFEDYCL